MFRRALMAGLAVGLMAAPIGADPVFPYTITHLGTLGGSWSGANDINESGVVVGTSRDAMGRDYAFLWTRGATDGVPSNLQMRSLGTLPGKSASGACEVNDTGWAVGAASATSGVVDRALLWLPDSQGDYRAFDLRTLGGSPASAYGINKAGQVVGESDNLYAQRHPFVLDPEDTDKDGVPDLWFRDADGDGANDLMTDLGTFGGGGRNIAFDINNSGLVVGQAFPSSGGLWPFLVRPEDTDGDGKPEWFRDDNGDGINDLMTYLGTLGGSDSNAPAINDSGWVAGFSTTSAGQNRGYVIIPEDTDGDGEPDRWYRDEEDRHGNPVPDGINDLMTILDTLGRTHCRAYGINDHGQVVGRCWGDEHAFLRLPEPAYGLSAGMHDLNNLVPPDSGWVLSAAGDINNAGQIVGIGHYEGQQRAFLMKPIPEPFSMAFMGGAFVGVVAYRLRKRREEAKK